MRVAARLALANLVALLLAAAVPATGAGSERVKVAATIFPLYDIARYVAGHIAEVVLVLPPGTSPHTFEPTPASVRALSGAEMLFAIGHGLDDWAARLARGAGVPQMVPVDARIALRRTNNEARGRVDPHYWLSAPNAEVIARIVAAELARRAPPPVRRPLREPYPGLEPSPQFVVEFQRKIRASGVRVVFTQPQLSFGALRPIVRDLGVTLAILDPLGGLPGRDGYIDLLRFNARAVVDAMRSRMP